MKHIFLTSEIKERNHLIDFIKTICIIFIFLVNTSVGDRYITAKGIPAYGLLMAVPVLFICSGFDGSTSYNKGNKELHNCYNIGYLLKKIVRIVFPWIVTFIIIEIATMSMNGAGDGNFVRNLFGYYTPGSYFIIIMVQMILFMPLIHALIKKYGWKSLIIFYILTMIFEAFRGGTYMSESTYKYLLIRYLPFISFGSYLANTTNEKFSFKNGKIDIILSIMFIGGAVYLYFVFYSGYICQFFFPGKGKESTFLAALYIIPIMFIIIKKCHLKSHGWGFVGRRTYSIYMILMIGCRFAPLIPGHIVSNGLGRFLIDFGIVFGAGIFIYGYLAEYFTTYKLMNLIQKRLNKKNIKKASVKH